MSKYKILYKLMHANGAVVNESWDEPLILEIGDGQLAPCLEACVREAPIGKLHTFLLTVDEAFGAIHDEAFQVMKRADFPSQMAIEKNAVVEFKTPTGDSYVGCIDKVEDDDITVNFNHLLAGSDVSFQVKVIAQQ